MKKGFCIHFMFVSPWLIAASIALMTLIVVVFGANNLRREVNLINDGLFHRGQSLANFIGAGTRASMLQGMEGAVHTQRLIEQASVEANILYIAVVDRSGTIISHSNPDKIGMPVDHEIRNGEKSSGAEFWHIIRDRESKKNVFEVVSEFSPFRRHRQFEGRGVGRMGKALELLNLQLRRNKDNVTTNDWCQKVVGMNVSDTWQGGEYQILIGLDMKEQEKVARQAKLHVLLVSMILLFVGLGGWLSLLAAQSYQASQSTLKNIQAFTNLLVLKLPVGIIATDENGRITTYNKAMAAMIDIVPEAVLAKRPNEILPPIVAGFFDELGEMDEVFEKEIALGKESKLIAHVSSVPVFDDANHPHGRVVLVYDLTEIKRLEHQVNQHDRLVALGKMAAGVAHEVRNPLSSIKGFATLFGAKFDKESEEHRAASLLVGEVERLNRCITELLNYSRPLPLKRKKVDLGRLVEESMQLMQGDAGALNIHMSVHVSEGVPLVSVDEDRVKQVLLNLYLNAFQSMAPGGELRISVHGHESRKGVLITVADNGCGIEPENLKRVTDPYYTTKADGTGLGLALAYKIVDEHGGTLNFSSVPGEGTAVEIYLPC